MADDAGVGCSSIGAVVDAHIGAADAGCHHADQNIIFLVDLRLFEINDLQFIRFNDLNALHKNLPPKNLIMIPKILMIPFHSPDGK